MKTKEQFINEAIAINGDKYDYSLVEYKGTNKLVKIICPVHGVFEQIAREHLHGHGCPICAKSVKRNTLEDFIQKAMEVHGDKYDYSKVEYISYHKKVCIICPEHGEFFKTPAKHISAKQGCPVCTKIKQCKSFEEKSSDTCSFIKRAGEVHGDKYDYSNVHYVNNTTPVKLVCPEHGTFLQRPGDHLSGCGCRKCADEKFKTSQADFIALCEKTWGTKYRYDKVIYKGSNKKITITCPIHGDFEVIASSFVGNGHNRGCRYCAIEEHRLTTNEFIQKAKEIHGEKYDYSKVNYINSDTKVEIICPKHGSFWQFPTNHLKGTNCPQCAAEINIFETRLYDELATKFPQADFIHSYKNKELLGKLELDIFSPTYKIAVEYQGGQHFHPCHFFGGEKSFVKQVERDKLKRNLCFENGIKLLEFSYDKYEKADNLITDISVLEEEIKNWLGQTA